MRRYILSILLMISVLICAPALAEYCTGAESAYFHNDEECEPGANLPISREAADEFGKIPCPECVVNIDSRAASRGGVTVLRVSAGVEDAFASANGQYAAWETDEYSYLLIPRSDSANIDITTAGGAQSFKIDINASEITANDAVIDVRDGQWRFMAFDFAGARVCSLTFSRDSGISLLAPVAILTGDARVNVVEYTNGAEHALNWVMPCADYIKMREHGAFSVEYESGVQEMIDPFFEAKTLGSGAPDIDKVRKFDDFCGAFLDKDGVYCVLVKSATDARAQDYAKAAGGMLRIAAGEYTYSRLESALADVTEIAGENFSAAAIIDPENCVEMEVRGLDCARLLDASLPACVKMTYGGAPLDRFDATEAQSIPRAPETERAAQNWTARMDRAEYPAFAGYVSFTLTVPEGARAVLLDGSICKYQENSEERDNYKLVKGDFSHTYTLAETGETSFCVDLSSVDQLGVGLYRLNACEIDGEPVALEFIMTETAPALDIFMPTERERITLTAHEAPSAAADFDSRAAEPVLTIGQWQLSARYIGLETAEKSYIIAQKPGETAARIYAGPFEGAISNLADAGDAIAFITDTGAVCLLPFDETEPKIVAESAVGPIADALLVGENMYVSTTGAIYRVSLSGSARRLWSPESGVASMEYYEGALHATSAAGISVTLK